MLRYIRYLLLATIGIVLLVVGMANRDPVTLNLLPPELARETSIFVSLTLPLYIVILGAVIVGVLLGFVWEWIREARIRAGAKSDRRMRERLEREMVRIKKKDPAASDDVLAILDNSSKVS
ncbi:MAG: LapA family protein [Pseudomonadota bacterium]